MIVAEIKQANNKDEPKGIECPKCGCRHFFVVYTRDRDGFIMRRRECRHCGRRLTTREVALKG